jgi:hypothetical protein
MSKPQQVRIRNKMYDTKFRIIRTEAVGADLYWVVKQIIHTGEETSFTSRISVDLWATGEWEVVQP